MCDTMFFLLVSELNHLNYGDGRGGDDPTDEAAGVQTQLQQQQPR